jgi:hypothetical protein
VSEPQRAADPDYRAASLAMWCGNAIAFALKAGADRESFERWRMLFDAVFQAISIRGARFGEVIEAVRKVREHGSILDDLPVAGEDTRRTRPPTRPGG